MFATTGIILGNAVLTNDYSRTLKLTENLHPQKNDIICNRKKMEILLRLQLITLRKFLKLLDLQTKTTYTQSILKL